MKWFDSITVRINFTILIFSGGIAEQNEDEYWFYGYINVLGNGFRADASKPNSLKNFICEFDSESRS